MDENSREDLKMLMKTTKDRDDCWSVWASDGEEWHWLMTSMGPSAEEDANRWMSNMSKVMENQS